MYVDKWCKC